MLILAVLFTLACAENALSQSPVFNSSFQIIAQGVPTLGEVLNYRYSYDAQRNRSSIITSRYNKTGPSNTVRFILDHESNQVVIIANNICIVDDAYSNFSVQVRANQLDLQYLLRNSFNGTTESTVSRGRPTVVYHGELDGVLVEATFTESDSQSNASTWDDSQPFAYKLTEPISNQTLWIYILGFVTEPDGEDLEIPYGTFCPFYKRSSQIRLPQISDATRKSLSFRAEAPAILFGEPPQWFEGYLSWIGDNLLYRIDFTDENRTALSIVNSEAHIASFVINNDGGPLHCTVVDGRNVTLPPQVNLIDPRAMQEMDTEKMLNYFYGLPAEKMTYKREDVKRGIPCSVYSVPRIDWPYNNYDESLWEWCFFIDPSDAKMDYPVYMEIHKGIPSNNQLFATYSFYATMQEDSHLSKVRDFDIRGCFDKESSASLVLELNVNAKLEENNFIFTSEFLFDLETAIVKASGMPSEDDIRVQHINLLPENSGVFVEFVILDVLSDFDNGDPLSEVVGKINKTLITGRFLVKHKDMSIRPKRDSLMTKDEFLNDLRKKPSEEVTLLRRIRSLSSFFSSDDLRPPPSMSLYLAYGGACLVFAIGCGVAIGEWYLRVHKVTLRTPAPAV